MEQTLMGELNIIMNGCLKKTGLAAVIISLLLLTACGGGGSEKKDVPITISEISISPSKTAFGRGEEITLSVNVTPDNTEVEWTATGGTLTQNGKSAKFSSDTPDTYTITVKAKTGSSAIKTTLVTVHAELVLDPGISAEEGLIAGADETEVVIPFTANAPWTATVIGDSGGETTVPTWITGIEPASGGAGGYSVAVTFTTNDTGQDRDAIVRIATGREQLEVKVTQTNTNADDSPAEELNITGISIRYVKAGTFMMGCDDPGNSSCSNAPAHSMSFTKDFYIGKYEVTQSQWKAVMDGANPTPVENVGDNMPVTYVNWDDVHTFIDRLNDNENYPQYVVLGWKWSLPTEAQWEYAARGGTSSQKYQFSGSDDVDAVAWYGYGFAGTATENRPYSVGQKNPNGLGLYDMSGNVDEWVEDFHRAYTNEEYPPDYPGPETGVRNRRVIRGGNWRNLMSYAVVWNRTYNAATYIDDSLGFRLALVPDPDYIPDAVATSTAKPTFFERASGTVSGLWDSAVSGVKSLWNSITK
jgi:formylglycine-generating enzyme required for sulfatase activity